MDPLNREWKTLSDGCFCAAKAVGCYFYSLRSAKVLPQDLGFEEHKFGDLIKKATNLPPISATEYRCAKPSCECQSEPTECLGDELYNEALFIKHVAKTFICLSCLKAGGRAKDKEKCRMYHS